MLGLVQAVVTIDGGFAAGARIFFGDLEVIAPRVIAVDGVAVRSTIAASSITTTGNATATMAMMATGRLNVPFSPRRVPTLQSTATTPEAGNPPTPGAAKSVPTLGADLVDASTGNPVQISPVAVVRVSLTTPVHPRMGYAPITVVNADGGSRVLAERMFYTDDCPFPNQFGSGLDCIDCPEGATCPGGRRMFPKPGYWTSDVTSGIIVRCDPPERCAGGRDAACATGYEGRECASCSPGWFSQESGLCISCSSATARREAIALILATVIFCTVFILSVVFMPDRLLNHVVTILATLQISASVGRTASSRVPGFLRSFYSALEVFSLDGSFVRPECSGFSGFAGKFYSTLALICAVVVPILIAVPLTMYVHLLLNRARGLRPGDVRLMAKSGKPITSSATIYAAGYGGGDD
jgi:hypothetical protein